MEIAAFSDDEFATRFQNYAKVWGSFVLPNREPGKISANQNWSNFAEHNYTAMIRCWHTFKAFQNIDENCTNLTGSYDNRILLELQGNLFYFFCNAGAAVENIRSACEAKNIEYNAVDLYDKTKHGSLGWFYERRNQYIHKIIVPLIQEDGLVYFDGSIFQDDSAVWQRLTYRNPTELFSAMNNLWGKYHFNVNSLWAKLFSHLKTKYPEHGSAIKEFDPFGQLGGVSGCPAPKPNISINAKY